MKFFEECEECLLKSQMNKVRKSLNSEDADRFYLRALEVCQNAPEAYCAPLLMRDLDAVHYSLFKTHIDYSEEKKQFNTAMLELEDSLKAYIFCSPDPLLTAVKLAMAANYIDFAQLTSFDDSAVQTVLDSAEKANVDMQVYAKFKDDLSTAQTLCYLHDNCGEIVLDKLLIITLRHLYPRITVNSVVRGGDIINDATMRDAKQVGLDFVAEVCGNGTAIPGTYLKEVSPRVLELIKSSDVVISKGLGNLETLSGEGYSIYYMLMAKCLHMAQRFGVELMQTVLYKE